MDRDYKNILIIKPSALGDIVHTLTVLGSLKKNFPDASIYWLVRPEFSALLNNNPYLDGTIVFDRKLLGKAWYSKKAFKELINLIKTIRGRNFDVVFDFQGLFRSGFFAWISKAKKRIGMKGAREFAGVFYTDKVSHTPEIPNVVDYHLKMIKAGGADDVKAEYVVPIDPEAEKDVSGMLEEHGIRANEYFLFLPAAARVDKLWPQENFAQIADMIWEKYKSRVVIAAAGSEKHIAEKIQSLSKGRVIDLSGRTNLHELICLIKSAKIVISNDTGPGHIANALGKALVMIFGRANPARVSPYQRPDTVVAVDPFGRRFTINNFEQKYDVKNITVAEVEKKIEEQLNAALPRTFLKDGCVHFVVD